MNSAHRGSKVVRLVALGLMAVISLAPSKATADGVMDQVPSDALGVLKKEQNTATIGLVWWFGPKQGPW